MTDEQSVRISLASPLDINSQDMLVPVDSPKFTYNRQKYQGSLLQTSVRYEADGWFAGWWGHNFDLVINANDYITPALGESGQLSVIRKSDENGNKVYVIKHKDLGLSYTYNPSLWSNWLTGSGNITRVDDATVSVTSGKTNKGNQFTATVNPYNGALIDFVDVGNAGLKAISYREGDNLRLEVVRDIAGTLTDFIDLRVNNVPEIDEIPLSVYKYDRISGLSNWNDVFTLEIADANTYTLTAVNKSFAVHGSPILYYYGTKDEQLVANVRDVTINHLLYSFNYKSYWVQDLFATVTPVSDSMSQQTTAVLENSMSAGLLQQGSADLIYNNSCVYRFGMPIWLQHRLEFDYRVVFEPIGLPVSLNNFKWAITTREDKDGFPVYEIPGFLDLINSPGVLQLMSFTLPGPSPHSPATPVDTGTYIVTQPVNTRFSLLTIDINARLVNGNLFIPVTFQPYTESENPDYDPRKVISAGDPIQTYGLSLTGSKAKKLEFNPDKFEQAKTADTIAAIDAIPNSRDIEHFVPEYEHTSGVVGVDLLDNPYYQPDPTDTNYDPREFVKAILDENPASPTYNTVIIDPAVKKWTIGQAAIANTANDDNWGVYRAPDYTRYWFRMPSLMQTDWDLQSNVTEFWPMYWPNLPVPVVPLTKPERVSPYEDTSISGVIKVIAYVATDPDTTDAAYQPMSAEGELLPPRELPYKAWLSIGNFVKKSILHGMKDITDKTNWSWAFCLNRSTIVTDKCFWSDEATNTKYREYFDSNAQSTGMISQLVWKPITENFPGMVVYDRPPATQENTGTSRTTIRDSWQLCFMCKNGETQFPIPTVDFYNPAGSGSNYFMIVLNCNGEFRNNQVLMYLMTGMNLQIPSYGGSLYNDNYKVLNAINLSRGSGNGIDYGILQGTNEKGIINMPLCVRGYAVSRVTTPRILNSNLSAFDIQNNVDDAGAGGYMWRIDRRAGVGYPYDLDLIKAELTSVQANSNTLYATYQTTGKGPFYQLTKQPYTIDYSTGVITGYQDYSYPDWILRNIIPIGGLPVGNYSENEYEKLYIPGAQAATVIANLTVIIKELDFIESIDVSQKYDRTPYNGRLFEDISQYYTVTKPEIVVIGGVETHNQTLLLAPEQPPSGTLTPVDTFTTVYNPDTTQLIGSPAVNFRFWEYVGYYTTGDTKKKVNSVTVDIRSPEIYDLILKRTLIVGKAGLMLPVIDILKQANHVVTFNPTVFGSVNTTTNKLYDSTVVTFVQNDTMNDVVRIYVATNNSALVYFKPVGLVLRSNNDIIYNVRSTQYELVFEYKNVEYTLHLDSSTTLKQDLIYSCTDIRTGEMFEVYRRNLDNMMMFVKQFWSNTVDVENFWWIDADHVLELAKHKLTLYKKIGLVDGKQSLHDWNGDNWTPETVGGRVGIISTEDLYYSVSSAYNTSGILFKFWFSKGNLELRYIDPLTTSDWENPDAWRSVPIPVRQVKLLAGDKAEALPHDCIAGYGPLNVYSLISTAKISSTTVKLQGGARILLIGIKQNNGLGQWCLKIDVTGAQLIGVVIGYGCVGPKGELTGGQIPIDYCGSLGFTGAVQELIEGLPERVNDIKSIPKIIVGTASQQWFIQETMTGIVSHLTFNVSNGVHDPVPLYLNNNVSALKHFATYRGARIQDIMPQSLNIATLFGQDNAAINVLMGVVSPSFFYFNIFYTVFAGVATAMGTYSYTWRNSNEIQVRGTEGLTDQDKSFGKYELNEWVKISNKNMHTWSQIIVHMIKDMPETVAQVVVNRTQGQSTVDDSTGRKFSQLFEDSVGSMVSTAIDSSGFNVRAQSIIKHQHSLTSFYSINDKIECHAGPGFVNHNLKAQCTAQSTQDVQFDGVQLGFFTILTVLTKLVLKQQNTALQAAYDAMERAHDNTAEQDNQISPGATVNWGYAAALAISAGMASTGAMIKLNEAIADSLDGIAEAFGGKVDAYRNNWIAKHEPTLEGLHTYGNKSMSFFWPAFGIPAEGNKYTNEGVRATLEPTFMSVSLTGVTSTFLPTIDESNSDHDDLYIYPFESGMFTGGSQPESANVPTIKCLGTIISQDNDGGQTKAPANMAVIEGTTSFLNPTPFKNEQVAVRPPVFGPPMIHDFMIDSTWKLGYTAGAGAIISVSCDDTKLIDGPPSNVVITDDFCGIASSYTAIEIKKTFDAAYLRPTMVTANAIGLNINKVNCVHDAKAYHAFDGQVNRIISWVGGQGMDKELLYQQYLFQMNDHFKRSNIFPPAQFFGSFQGPPTVLVETYNEIVSNTIVEQTSGLGFGTNTPGENRNLQRFSTCVFSELLSSLPTTIRTLAPYKLRVNDGVTCLVTELRNTNTRYKAPTSIDFNIGTRLYRKTEEYIVEITEKSGVVMTETRTPSAGLEFVGPTMTAAYFYSSATKLYYEYAGGTELQKQDILNRFRNVREGRWDFINQEIIFSVQQGYTNEELVLRLDNGIHGEVWPPNKTIYNERSGYKIYSCAGGLVYQGPKRFIVSRFVTLEHMIPDIKRNKRKWKRVNREAFIYERDYGWEYKDLHTETPVDAVFGWTHNPYLLVTSMIGTAEDVDNKFEWSLTFAWSETIGHILEDNEYVTVNIMAETVTQGGVVRQRPTHIFLNKEVFTRSDNAGYYTAKFQSNNGTGNRERLFIWSDGVIAIEDLKIACKQISTSRTQPLITQVDLERLVEL